MLKRETNEQRHVPWFAGLFINSMGHPVKPVGYIEVGYVFETSKWIVKLMRDAKAERPQP